MTSQVESSNTAVVGSSIDKLEYFTQWSQSRGIQISGVAPALLPGRGLGLVAIEDLKQGQRIVLVPNKAMLRPVMSASGTSKPDMHKEISRQAQLAMTLMAECRKVDSPLRLWEATWPSRVDLAACMPIQWEPSLQRLLPPATQDLLKDQIEEYGRDLNAAVQLCGHGFDNPEFMYYWCIVSTRGFHFKPVGNSPAYTIMCPFLDFANHGPSGSGIKVEQTRNGYEAVLDRDYAANTEIVFTYGSRSNDRLLVEYGFMASSTTSHPVSISADDSIPIDDVLIPALLSVEGKLRSFGYWNGYVLDSASAKVCHKTQVAVRALLLDERQFMQYCSRGEDSGGIDRTQEVNGFLAPLFETFLKQVRDTQRNLDALEGSINASVDKEYIRTTAVSLIRERWAQIELVVATWLSMLGSRGHEQR